MIRYVPQDVHDNSIYNSKIKRKILKVIRGRKRHSVYRRLKKMTTVEFLSAITANQMTLEQHFIEIKKTYQCRIMYPAKTSFKIQGKI